MRFFLFLLLCTAVSGQESDPAWLKLDPLQSTRETVEKLLGPPDDFDSEYSIGHYELPKGSLHVFYSLGKCDEKLQKWWKVPTGVMTEIEFFPDDGSEPRLNEYARITRGFNRTDAKDTEGHYFFFTEMLSSPDRSIQFAVLQTKERGTVVTAIYLRPKQSDWDQHCPKSATEAK